MFLRFILAATVGALGQAGAQQPGQPAAPADRDTAEMTARDQPVVFRQDVNLVMVPVVVRDPQGRCVGNLQREDFQLFDQGKPQAIARFSVEKRDERRAAKKENPGEEAAANPQEQGKGPPVMAPERFVAYLFDDVHLDVGNLVRARNAAIKHLGISLQPADRAAVFSTSGQGALDFTGDRKALAEALLRLRPRERSNAGPECPRLSYYMADLIRNKEDREATRALIVETMGCLGIDPATPGAEDGIRGTLMVQAKQVLEVGNYETRLALNAVKDLVRRLAAMPGQRTIILVSPGFHILEDRFSESDIMDRAIRSRVVISSLEARGVYTTAPGADGDGHVFTPQSHSARLRYDMQAASAQSGVLEELADGTGGFFFHNSNDLVAGFQRVAAAPEYTYILGFAPRDLKLDGKYHALKVKLREAPNLTVTARHGYLAPPHGTPRRAGPA